MTQEEKKAIIDKCVEEGVKAQIRDDVCSRSTLVGLKSYFDWIPDEMIKASASLCGGTGSASGSCGAYCCGLLAVGLKYNSTIDEELQDEEAFGKTAMHFSEYRDKFIGEMGSILCPKVHEKLFGRSYNLLDDAEAQEFLTLPGHVEKCAETVATATRLAAEMLLADE